MADTSVGVGSIVNRRRAFVLFPVGLFIGGWAIGSEIAAHGFSEAVVIGLISGSFASAAMVALMVSRWNREYSESERKEMKIAWARLRKLTVPVGMSAALVGIALPSFTGGLRSVGTALMAGVGVVFIVAACLTLAAALGRRGLFSVAKVHESTHEPASP